MLKIESGSSGDANRKILAWIFTIFAVVPFVLWVYDHVTRTEIGILGDWPMLVVTVFFTSMSLIVSNPHTSKSLAGGMVGGIVGMFRSKSGISEESGVPDHTHDDRDLPS